MKQNYCRIAFLICAILSSLAINAKDFKFQGLEYTVLDENLKTVSTKAGTKTSGGGLPIAGNMVAGTISIPSTVSDGTYEYSVTAIGKYGFSECKDLENIQLPSTLNEIGKEAFGDCYSLKSIIIPDGVSVIKSYVFCGCFSLSEVKLPSGLISIEENAFDSCPIKEIELPSSLKKIGDYAFSSLTVINIPYGVTELGAGALSCWDLEKVYIPGSISKFGEFVFLDCENIREVYYNTTNPIDAEASQIFYGCDIYDTATLYVPFGAKSKMQATEPWCNFEKIVETEMSGVEEILIGDTDLRDTGIYTIDGRKINSSADSLHSGIYLIKTASGFRKVML